MPRVNATAITLENCVQRVVERNETIQMRALEWLASQKRLQAAKGIFEPDLVGTIERNENRRKNTVERVLSVGTSEFNEKNTIYSGGIEALSPTGGKVRLGYSMRDLANNLQQRLSLLTHEYETFAGITVNQPLLKNGGVEFTMAGIRLAAGESELAFQEYRRQMMLMIARAEAAYWDLFFTQEQTRIRTDSVKVARTILKDNRVRLQVGKASDLDVMQGEAAVALREARLMDAEQRRVETMRRLTALISGSSATTNIQYHAQDRPAVRDIQPNFFDSMREAMELNPDYASQRQQITQEKIRVAYARNQTWPQVDLKGSYGLNGLNDSVASSWQDIESRGWENWSVGVELRIPLTGGIKGRNELSAAKLRQREALLALKSAEVEIANSLETAVRRVANTRESVRNYEKVVQFNERLLQTEMSRMDLGKTDIRKILEVEEYLSEARSTALENLIGFEKSLIEWQLIKGTLLKDKQLEFSKARLKDRTQDILKGLAPQAIAFDRLQQEAKQEFEQKWSIRPATFDAHPFVPVKTTP